ncbi:LysR family transcriptional regulator [Ancylobacter pratisalsi]|uniref:LysR family transcriptional regulator n=1 Tax=Ancylobacter pratisalsi TaxID=1745854 RepID=A0A6P1YKM3_9HYPH|nr:LysR family transcriptional regulator [Ancylobacter pratisalsi]QIB33878.1 LysR family transcriptional regulator [Ancylobacter pratisalsi]
MDLAVALRAFIRTVERGSMTAAARDLGISQPAVTKHLRNLERHVGARLLERSARLVRPTWHGQALFEASRTALVSIDEAVEGVRRDMQAIEGPLRVHSPCCIGARHLHPIMMTFQERHPGVTFDLVLEGRVVDLVYENFDLAIRYGRPEGQDLVIRRIGSVRRILVASPDLLARTGPVDSPTQVTDLPFVTTPSILSPRDRLVLSNGAESVEPVVRPVLRTNDAQVLLQTLRSGHAMGAVQELLVSDDIAAGRLVRVLPAYHARPAEAFMTYPSIRYMRPAVRAFTDFAVSALQAVAGMDVNDPSIAASPSSWRGWQREPGETFHQKF